MSTYCDEIPVLVRDASGERETIWHRPKQWHDRYRDSHREASSRFFGTLVARTLPVRADFVRYEHIRPAIVCNVMNKLKTRMYDTCRRHDADQLPLTPAQMARDFIGCSPSEFVEKLEAQFDAEMNWDNWVGNGWHIDHITPVSWFDFRDIAAVKKACHYRNLRPMWAAENIRKGNSLVMSGDSK